MWYKRPYNFFIYSSLMIIVTGGAGFIGSNIVAALEKAGKKDLVVVDELGSSDKWKNIAKRELCAVIPPEDMLDYMEAHAEEIEAVIHMGAISATTETDADLIIRTNFTLSWRLWEFCALYGKQFIYASSAATYGDGSMGFDDDSSLEHVNALRPLNAYGWSKALFDRKVAREVKEGRPVPPQYAGLKFFNVYGPNEYHKGGQKSVVAHIFPQVKVNETVKLFKSYHPDYRDGWQLRDFVWVGDCVNVVLWLLDHPEVKAVAAIAGFNSSTEWLRYAVEADDPSGNLAVLKQYVPLIEQMKFGKYADYTALDGFSHTQAGVMIIQSSDDRNVPPAVGYDLYVEKYGQDPRFRFQLFKNRGHLYLFYTDAARAYDLQRVDELNATLTAYGKTHAFDKAVGYALDLVLFAGIREFFDKHCVKALSETRNRL